MSESKVGDVIHYFDKIHVAILELTDELAVGDTLKFVRAASMAASHHRHLPGPHGRIVKRLVAVRRLPQWRSPGDRRREQSA